MPYEVLYMVRGEKDLGRVLKTFKNEARAFAFCRKIENFPADTMHYAITCEDGRILHDTRKDGDL